MAKSSLTKAKERRLADKKRQIALRSSRAWRVLLLVIKAAQIFLKNRKNASIAAQLPPSWGLFYEQMLPSDVFAMVNNNSIITLPSTFENGFQPDDFSIVRDVVEGLVNKICHQESDRISKKNITILLLKTYTKRNVVKESLVNIIQILIFRQN